MTKSSNSVQPQAIQGKRDVFLFAVKRVKFLSVFFFCRKFDLSSPELPPE